MMLEKKPDAARMGFPGRTQLAGRRLLAPSTVPRRLSSASSRVNPRAIHPPLFGFEGWL